MKKSYVHKKILEYVDIDERYLSDDTNLVLDLHMNSYDCVSIIGDIEVELGIEIPDIEIRNLQTIRDMADYLNSKERNDLPYVLNR